MTKEYRKIDFLNNEYEISADGECRKIKDGKVKPERFSYKDGIKCFNGTYAFYINKKQISLSIAFLVLYCWKEVPQEYKLIPIMELKGKKVDYSGTFNVDNLKWHVAERVAEEYGR